MQAQAPRSQRQQQHQQYQEDYPQHDDGYYQDNDYSQQHYQQHPQDIDRQHQQQYAYEEEEEADDAHGRSPAVARYAEYDEPDQQPPVSATPYAASEAPYYPSQAASAAGHGGYGAPRTASPVMAQSEYGGGRSEYGGGSVAGGYQQQQQQYYSPGQSDPGGYYAPPTQRAYGAPTASEYSYGHAASEYGYSRPQQQPLLQPVSSKAAYMHAQPAMSEYSSHAAMRSPAPAYNAQTKYAGTPVPVVPLSSKAAAGNAPYGGPSSRRDSVGKSGSARYCCGCFATRRNCVITFLLITLVLLGVGGFLVWFLFPRAPTITTSSPFIPTSIPPNLPTTGINSKWLPGGPYVTGNLFSATQATPFTFQLGLAVNVTVYSDNNVGFNVNSIDVTGTLQDPVNTELPVGSSTGPDVLSVFSQVVDVHIDKKANTTIMLPITVLYNKTSALTDLRNDPVISALARSCGLGASLGLSPIPATPKLWMKVDVTLDLKIIAWTGFKPELKMPARSFDCPPTLVAELNTLLSSKGQAAVAAVAAAAGGGTGAGTTSAPGGSVAAAAAAVGMTNLPDLVGAATAAAAGALPTGI
ncbi:hypothetical protein HKX48_006241 [Thoreauomyces humboldtii]|nr:hypothetical protein HKX48_006241 [Thoreauomyces humboldtii]